MITQVTSTNYNGGYLQNNATNIINAKNTFMQQPSFQRNILQTDVVEVSKPEKKGLSKSTKTAITIGTIAGLALTAVLMYKRFKPVKLAEHIDFSPAQTAEEALKFTKKHLGIKKIDKEIAQNLDVMNWVNESLVKVNNAAKGKAVMPKVIHGVAEAESAIAAMNPSYRTLSINVNWIKNLDKHILEHDMSSIFQGSKDEGIFSRVIADYKDIVSALGKLKNNQLSFNEKVALSDKLDAINLLFSSARKQPKAIAQRLHDAGYKMKFNGKVYGTVEELTELFQKVGQSGKGIQTLLMGYYNAGLKFSVPSRTHSYVLAHEMGHSEHYRKVGFDKFFAMSKIEEFKQMGEPVSEITKEFIASQDKQALAEQISGYAKTSPLEFVAEVYSNIVDGKKIPTDILSLYKQYGGPMVAA